jgi:hypothetical protein
MNKKYLIPAILLFGLAFIIYNNKKKKTIKNTKESDKINEYNDMKSNSDIIMYSKPNTNGSIPTSETNIKLNHCGQKIPTSTPCYKDLDNDGKCYDSKGQLVDINKMGIGFTCFNKNGTSRNVSNIAVN